MGAVRKGAKRNRAREIAAPHRQGDLSPSAQFGCMLIDRVFYMFRAKMLCCVIVDRE